MLEEIVTAEGTPNIALVKYWGKRDDKLILPINSSVSMTLAKRKGGKFSTITSVVFSKRLKKDTIYVDGKKRDIKDKRVNVVVDRLRQLAKTNARVLIVSKNRFPADAGMASSASGIATLTFACAKALGLRLSMKELSMVARLGSGSAARSMYGGFVIWQKGKRRDGSDSYAVQIKPHSHWSDMIDIIAITERGKKAVPTSEAMRRTERTSRLFKARPEIAEVNAREIVRAIKKKDFDRLARITMQDSNSMHAVMLDSMPPVIYMNAVSKKLMRAIERLNDSEGRAIAAYTLDAGPNVHIITTKRNEKKVKRLLDSIEGIVSTNTLKIGKSGPVLSKGRIIDKERLAPAN